MKTNELNKRTIYLNTFFNDVENDLITENDGNLLININSESYNEYLDNMDDMDIGVNNALADSFEERYKQTIKAYYEKFSDKIIESVKIINDRN